MLSVPHRNLERKRVGTGIPRKPARDAPSVDFLRNRTFLLLGEWGGRNLVGQENNFLLDSHGKGTIEKVYVLTAERWVVGVCGAGRGAKH
ncbi:hypothetical protein I7I50_04455 [Histoplasma capsulatum G186AR]|uniref:Uncharacterized protein n=1 Tax=Ajellomyces capsulatus TaxID=5037 RepID=A0A8H7YPR5_AJECA|nr:hypothetical protein I7I52_05363 [Histoplasma capsulatum]QSS75344.1 hypothetical protein I7I50_04455 [Histoplasma capsulatum G186AR]